MVRMVRGAGRMKLLAWLLGAAAVCKEFCAAEFGENVCDKVHAKTCGTCEGCTSEGDADDGGDGDAASIWLPIWLLAGAAFVPFAIYAIYKCKRERARVYAVAQVPSNPKRFQHGSWVAAQLAALPQGKATNLD